MPHTVTEACIRCKYTDCAGVCPAAAIFAAEDVPADQQDFTLLNARLATRWPLITRTKRALLDEHSSPSGAF